MSKEKKKIFVGISGGVDSSVVAHLLKKEGHEVHGVFIKTWSPEWLPCTWREEKRDAMRVCAALDIPFHFLDAEIEYKEGVADYMIEEYRKGRTPNPDVLCNRVIKFGALWKFAKMQGADVVATGHYASIEKSDSNFLLKKGVDQSKDQSYFLWMIKKEELNHIIFPLGDLDKSEVRKIAKRAGLFTATKKDSQGVCFLGDVDMKEFLSHYIENKVGDVLNTKGEIIGSHDGVWFYTIGERHGFKIETKENTSKPYYIVSKDIENNVLVVSNDVSSLSKAQSGSKKIISLREENWLTKYKKDKEYSANVRYHGADLVCKIIEDEKIEITTGEEIAIGQSVVIYDKGRLIGGGIIDKVF